VADNLTWWLVLLIWLKTTTILTTKELFVVQMATKLRPAMKRQYIGCLHTSSGCIVLRLLLLQNNKHKYAYYHIKGTNQ